MFKSNSNSKLLIQLLFQGEDFTVMTNDGIKDFMDAEEKENAEEFKFIQVNSRLCFVQLLNTVQVD